MADNKQQMISLLTGIQSSKKNYYAELKNTVEQLKKKNMQLEIIHEVMKSIKVDMSVDQMLNNIVHKLEAIIQFDRLSLSLLKNGKLFLTNVYPASVHSLPIDSEIPDQQSLYWDSLRKQQSLQLHINEHAPAFYEKAALVKAEITRVLVVPLHSKTNAVGVLCIGRKPTTNWEQSDIVFLEQLADQFAVGIENASLFNEVLHSKKQWEDTFQAVDDLLLVFDTELQVVQYNDSVKTRYYDHVHGKLVLSSDVKKSFGMYCTGLVKKTLSTKQPAFREVLAENNQIFEMSTYPIFNDKQNMYAVIAYCKDVTEKRRMEAQLIHSDKLAAVGEMAAGVAHELNSPLTAILGNSQLLLRNREADDPAYPLLKDINNCGERCRHIIRSLLTFSRQEPVTFERFSINEAVKHVLQLLKFQIERNQIEVRIDLQDNLPEMKGSRQQVEQIITNLLINARDAVQRANREKKTITIRTGTVQENLYLTITDNGIGIEADQLHDIFRPFYTTKNKEKGTGLGLSVSLGIAEAHGGTIEVTSKPGLETVFRLQLPVPE
ncbi:two-component system, NtrC family, sensor kinase [Evansella caseinilytica]|uniref:histidine kinase n=1 Tax=Evansella caseinilytica TaxID=1503961 RepID=A0A1H3IFJ0_9BACI|nr:ATP-binding protein [Evansella caseinilytica]SDY26566.1 two-component system, NtrC family, sensor kinase [Evansella caseinilytica]